MSVVRRASIIDPRSADFQRRYEPNFAARCLSSVLQGMPGIRGIWLASQFTTTGALYDSCGCCGDLTLTRNSAPLYYYDSLVPVIQFDGTDDYFYRADEQALDINGQESYVYDNANGLTLGIWCKPTAVPAGQTYSIIGKADAAANELSYQLRITDLGALGDRFRARISDDGTSVTLVTSTVTVTSGAWHYVCMSFQADVLLSICVNGEVDTEDDVPTSLYNSAADFVIGAQDGGDYPFEGYLSAAWLAAAYWPPRLMRYVYEQTRAAFGA